MCLEGSRQTFMMEQEKAEELLAADTFALVDFFRGELRHGSLLKQRILPSGKRPVNLLGNQIYIPAFL